MNNSSHKKTVILTILSILLLADILAMLFLVVMQPRRTEALSALARAKSACSTSEGSYSKALATIAEKNEELDGKIAALQVLVDSEQKPMDESLLSAAKDSIAKAEDLKYSVEELSFEDVPLPETAQYGAIGIKEIQADTKAVDSRTAQIKEAISSLQIPNYSGILTELDEAQTALDRSIRIRRQITDPSVAFVLKRLESTGGISDAQAADISTDTGSNLFKTDGYRSLIYFITENIDKNHFLVFDDHITDGNYLFYYYLDTPASRGIDGGGVVEVFETEELAQARDAYLSEHGNTAVQPYSHCVCVSSVVKLSKYLTEEDCKVLEDAIVASLTELR